MEGGLCPHPIYIALRKPFLSVILSAAKNLLAERFFFEEALFFIGKHLREILRAEPSE